MAPKIHEADVPEQDVVPSGRKAVRKPRGKDAATPGRKAALKVKLSLQLTAEAATRLRLHAAMLDEFEGDLVSDLIMQGLRRYRVQDLDRPKADADASEDRQSDAA